MITYQAHEKRHQLLAQNLAKLNLAITAQRLGYSHIENSPVRITFLGQKYIVSNDDVRALDQEKQDPIIRSLIAGYFFQQGFGEPAYSFVSLGQLTGPLPV